MTLLEMSALYAESAALLRERIAELRRAAREQPDEASGRAVRRRITELEPLLENDMVTEALVLLFTNIKKEKEFYIRVSRLDGQNSFENTVKACVKKTLLNVLRESLTGRQPKYAWLTPELIAEYYSQSMCCIVLTWIRSGMTVSPKELAEIYNYILTRSIADVLADL